MSTSPAARGPKRPADGGRDEPTGGSPPAPSLTVRYGLAGGVDETWRRPPGRLDGAPGWPGGWVEVRRRRRAAGIGGGVGPAAADANADPGWMQTAEDDVATARDHRVVTQDSQDEFAEGCSLDDGGLSSSELKPPPEREAPRAEEETVEYHPPPRRGGGKRPRVLRSDGEARRHLAEQERRRARREQRRETQSGGGAAKRAEPRQEAPSPPRRTSGRARRPASRPEDPGTAAAGGSTEELNRIMRRDDRPARSMRECILLSAVLSRRRSTLDFDGGFVGPGGRAYPDLRRSFGKFADVKACALCKARVQGHWYCRIANGHADKLDWDGGDSARGIREMYGADVEELEGRLRDLIDGNPGGEGRRSTRRSDSLAGGGKGDAGDGSRDPASWSMDLLSDELLYHVASYVPSLPSLAALSATSRRASASLLSSRPDDPRSESLYRGVYLRSFGPAAASGNFEGDLPWVSRWRMVRGIGRGFATGGILPVPAGGGGRETMGILSPRDERDALLYDNFDGTEVPPGRNLSNGYFNVSVLHLPRPPNCRGGGGGAPGGGAGGLGGGGVVPARGHRTAPRRRGGRDSRPGGAGAGGGQALCLVRNDLVGTTMVAGRRYPCFFLGFASGLVGSVSARLSEAGDGYEYDMDGTCRPHAHEVTALAVVDCGPRPVLFSSCGGGNVYSHPSALDASRDYAMDSPVLAMSNRNGRGIFSMAATSVLTRDWRGTEWRRAVICTGDGDGNVRLWVQSFPSEPSGLGLLFHESGDEMPMFDSRYSYRSSSRRGGQLVTRAAFLCGNVLACGTVEGDIRLWRLERTGVGERREEGLVLTLQHDHPRAHPGPVEVLSGAGDVLLTSGGGDGRVTAWSVRTGLRLGGLRCGRGRPASPGNDDGGGGGDGGEGRRYYSCVVGVAIAPADRQLFCFCRDGTYMRLSYVD